MRGMKKWLSGLLAAAIIVTSVPLGQAEASETAPSETQNVSSEVQTVAAGSTSSQIKDVTIEDMRIIEYTSGHYETVYNSKTGKYDLEWYRYTYNPTVTVTLEDGSVITGEWVININGAPYFISCDDDQSYENQWGVGKHTATARFAGTETTFTVEIVENPIESISTGDVSITEYTNGYYATEYNPKTGNYDLEWYRYTYTPTVTVTLKDGSVITGKESVDVNGEHYSLSYRDDQSYGTPWKVGKHTVTARLGGKETTFTVEMVESPVASISVEDVSIAEYTNGYYATAYNPETGQFDIEWYRYNYTPTVKVTLKDGSVRTANGSVNINGVFYSLSYSDGQSYENQWGVGRHTVTARLGGIETTFTVEIVEGPIASVSVEDISIHEYTSGSYMKDWNPETGNYDLEWYRYNYTPTVRVTLKDGSVKTGKGSVYVNGAYYYLSYSDGQSYGTPWGIGKHTVTGQIAGKEATFTVEITESLYTSLEVLKILPVVENKDCRVDGNGNVIYDIPVFSYKLTAKDGSYVTGLYDYNTDRQYFVMSDVSIRVIDTQSEKPWTVGGDNSFVIKYGDLEVTVPVEMQKASDFEYVEQNDGLYITDCRVVGETIEIPETINGKKVVGIVSLGDAIYSAKNVVIPDTVKSIGAEVFNGWESSVETISIGSGVTYLDVNTFGRCYNLKSVTISKNNPNYCDVDGVVYDKEIKTLIYYPIGKGNDYTVPATVTNIDILNGDIYRDLNILFAEGSTAFVTVDGITYTADMKKVVFCNPSKTGSYVMPDTVTEIATGAFKESNLTEIKISDNVTEIVYETFRYSWSLTKVQLPANLKSIGDSAFYHSGLTELTIPDSVVEIGKSAFVGTSISKLDLGQGIQSIGENAFSSIDIESIIIPKSVTNLGDGTFQWCMNLKKVEFKGKNISLGNYVFCECPLEDINLENVTGKIGEGAFAGTNLKSISLPESVTEIAYWAFESSQNLEFIDVPESAVRVSGRAFEGTAWENAQKDGPVYLEHIFYDYKGVMPENTDLVIKAGTTVLADSALQNREELNSIVLPEGLKTIGETAFLNASNLKAINIPASVSFIGTKAFAGCESLEAIHVDPANQYYSSVDGVLFNKDKTELICCPKRANSTYEVPGTVTLIRDGAFGDSGVENIKITNENVVLEPYSIGYRCFEANAYYYRYVTIHCVEGSTAHQYAKENLLGVNLIEREVAKGQWVKDSKGWWYQNADGSYPTNCWQEIDGAWYYFDAEGYMVTGWKEINGTWYYLDESGVMVTGWRDINGARYYFKESGAMVTGWQDIDGARYYFDGSGAMTANKWQEIDGSWYYFDESGKLTKTGREIVSISVKTKPNKTSYCVGEAEDQKGLVIKVTYEAGPDMELTEGFKVSGFNSGTAGNCKLTVEYEGFKTTFDVTISEHNYVTKSDSANHWQECSVCGNEKDSAPHVYDNDCDEICNECGKTRSTTHDFGEWEVVKEVSGTEDGLEKRTCKKCGHEETRVIQAGKWIQDSIGWWYRRSDGSYPHSCLEEINGQMYYFNASGYMVTGWQMLGGTWYYFDGSGAMVTGWQAIGGIWYYFNGSGAMMTGWQLDGETWYYFNGSGAMVTGWQAIGGTWYYFDGSGAMVTGWQAIGGIWYYFNGSGAMLTGWQLISGTWYYFNGSGAMMIGWQLISGTWYYFNGSGAMVTGWQLIGGAWYYFDGSGAMVANQWVGNYYLQADGSMATNKWVGGYYVGADGAWIP